MVGLVLVYSVASFFTGAIVAFAIAGQRGREREPEITTRIVEQTVELCEGEPLADSDYFDTGAFSEAAAQYCRDSGYVREEDREEPPSRYQ